jgi:hypothetical protein
MGRYEFSDAKTHESGFLSTTVIHSRSWLAVFGGMATVRLDVVVFGVLISPR